MGGDPPRVQSRGEPSVASLHARIALAVNLEDFTLMHISARFTCLATFAVLASVAACGSDVTGPDGPSGVVQLTAAQVHSLDSAVNVAADNNPGNEDVRTLADSALDVLAAGVQAKQIAINTDVTTAPLMFVGIHRAFTVAGAGSFSTWTVVGFDNPAHVSTLIDLGGYAAGGATPPNSASGAIGGSGVGNARFFQLGSGGALTSWIVSSGNESFVSDSTTPGGACPGFKPIAHVTCTTETMHVHFDVQAAGSTGGGAGPRHASALTDVDVPTMRLDYKF
jgi:hypothetical protein